MLSAGAGLDEPLGAEQKETTLKITPAPTTTTATTPTSTEAADQTPTLTSNTLDASERKIATPTVHLLSKKEKYYIRQKIAQERLKRYSAKHFKGDMFAIGKVQRAVVNIQRMMRGKIAREQYNSLQSSRYALIELLLFLVYLIFHVWFAVLRKDNVDMFYLSKMMEDGIVHEEFPGPGGTGTSTYIKKTFLDVAHIDEFWDYLEGPFRNNVFPERCRDPDHNGDPCLGAMNTVNHIVGTVRIRQFRVKEMTNCPVPHVLSGIPSVVNSKCYGSWEISQSSLDDFGMAMADNSPSKWNKVQNKSFANLLNDKRVGDLKGKICICCLCCFFLAVVLPCCCHMPYPYFFCILLPLYLFLYS